MYNYVVFLEHSLKSLTHKELISWVKYLSACVIFYYFIVDPSFLE